MSTCYSIKINRRNRNCNSISNPYSKVFVPDVIKNITARVLNLISWKNQAKQIKWHESCKCVCKLDPIICNNKQKWNKDKSRCQCKKLVHKKCDNDFIWNPSSCKYKCKKKASHLLIKQCENEIIQNKTQSVNKYNKTMSIKECNTSLNSCKSHVY